MVVWSDIRGPIFHVAFCNAERKFLTGSARPRAQAQQARGLASGPVVAEGVEGRPAGAAVLGGWERQAQASAQQRLEAVRLEAQPRLRW